MSNLWKVEWVVYDGTHVHELFYDEGTAIEFAEYLRDNYLMNGPLYRHMTDMTQGDVTISQQGKVKHRYSQKDE